jgi:outer membrane beta-barrel protein
MDATVMSTGAASMNDLADDFDPSRKRTAARGETAIRAMRRGWIALPVLLAALCAPAALPSAQAQEIEVSGPLAGAPAVIGLRAYREMRFQIQAHTSMTLEDEFSRAVLVGGQLMFHPTDWLGIGAWGGFSLANIDTSLTDEVSDKGQTNQVNVLSLPNPDNFASQIGQIQWMAAPQVAFIPLRGKLGIFEKLFVDTDFYLLGGIAFIGIEERAAVNENQFDNCRAQGGGALAAQIQCFEMDQGQRESRTAMAPTFGVGLSLYMADFVAMTIEWRALPFAWNTSGTDESGDSRGDFPDDQINEDDRLSHFNHMMTLGFAFYFPTEPSRSHMLDEETGKD